MTDYLTFYQCAFTETMFSLKSYAQVERSFFLQDQFRVHQRRIIPNSYATYQHYSVMGLQITNELQ